MSQQATVENAEENENSGQRAAVGAAVDAENGPSAAVVTGRVEGQENEPAAPVDADLLLVNERWPSLPEPIRRAIVALVRTSS